MNKILILGSKGSLALAMAKVYNDLDVTGWDHAELDITNESEVERKITELAPNLVINCAAYNSVDKAETDRATADAVNGYALGYIARVCKQIGAVLVHYSTGQVFDGGNKDGYNEDDTTHPVNAYGTSKLMGEMEVQKNTDQFYLIRTAWLFGPSLSGKKSFIDIMLEMAETDQTINCIEDEFGTPTYVHDLAQATRALIETHKPYGIYHLINDGVVSRFDWAQEIFKIKNIKAKFFSMKASEFPPRAATRPQYEVLKNTKFIQLRPWAEALEEFLNT